MEITRIASRVVRPPPVLETVASPKHQCARCSDRPRYLIEDPQVPNVGTVNKDISADSAKDLDDFIVSCAVGVGR